MNAEATVLAWHFLTDDSMTRYEPRVAVTTGLVLEVEADKIQLCEYGLHASVRAIDALQYAPGAMICRVELSGKIIHGDDKLCASRRTVIAMADATNVLHEMARWLAKKATDEELSAAESAARSAAESAAWSAAESAAWSAAESAARSAAESAAESAAWSAAWSAQNEVLTAKLLELLGL